MAILEEDIMTPDEFHRGTLGKKEHDVYSLLVNVNDSVDEVEEKIDTQTTTLDGDLKTLDSDVKAVNTTLKALATISEKLDQIITLLTPTPEV